MAEWIIGLIGHYGYLAVAALMFLENVLPPIPSELIMPFAGFAAARGDLHPLGAAAAGAAGSLAGTLPWYWAGRRVGSERLKRWATRHGRWLTVSPEDIDSACRWFRRRGAAAVFLGRLVPGVRSLISAPAGIAAMPFLQFILWSAIGSLLWAGALCALGFWLEGHYDVVERWMNPVTQVVLGLAVACYLFRVARFKQKSS